MEGYLAEDLMDLEVRLQRLERRNLRQELREVQDPFDLTDTEFKELYRLNTDLLSNLVDGLTPRLQHTRITGLSVEKQVFISIGRIGIQSAS